MMTNTKKRQCLVTVGSTCFDDLIKLVLTDKCLSLLANGLGITHLTVQYGRTSPSFQAGSFIHSGSSMLVNLIDYIADVDALIVQSDIVISHGGAATLLAFAKPCSSNSSHAKDESIVLIQEAKGILLAVANPRLMDNHQSQLIEQFDKAGYCIGVEGLDLLLDALERLAGADALAVNGNGARSGMNKLPDIKDDPKRLKALEFFVFGSA